MQAEKLLPASCKRKSSSFKLTFFIKLLQMDGTLLISILDVITREQQLQLSRLKMRKSLEDILQYLGIVIVTTKKMLLHSYFIWIKI